MKFKANLIQQLTGFGRNLVDEYHSFSPLGKKLTWGGGIGFTGLIGYQMLPGPRARRREIEAESIRRARRLASN